MASLLELPPEELHPGVLALLVLVSLVGIIGNLFIIGTVVLNQRLRTVGNCFVVNLAFADFVVTAYIMPIGIATTQFQEYPFNSTFCDANGFVLFLTLGVSTQTLMVIALERYVHICHPARYSYVFGPRLAALYIGLVWVHSAAWACQGFTGLLEYSFFPSIYLCAMRLTHPTFNICMTVIGMVLPVLAMAFSYSSILHTVRRSHAAVFKKKKGLSQTASTECLTHTQKKMKGEHRFILTLFIIVVVFLVCWTPTALMMSIFNRSENLSAILFFFATWLSLSNSSMNAIIYGAMNKNFRRGYKNLAWNLVCCRKDTKDGVCCKCPSGIEDSQSTSQSKLPGGQDAHQMAARKPQTHTTVGRQQQAGDASKVASPVICSSQSKDQRKPEGSMNCRNTTEITKTIEAKMAGDCIVSTCNEQNHLTTAPHNTDSCHGVGSDKDISTPKPKYEDICHNPLKETYL